MVHQKSAGTLRCLPVFYFFSLYAANFPVVIGPGFSHCPVSPARSGAGRHRHAGALFDPPSCFIAPCLRSRTYHGGKGAQPPENLSEFKNIFPLPYRKGTDSIPVSLREGGERAPVALCREPVYVATPVGAERSPLATSARAGRRDGGGHRSAYRLGS